MSKTQEQKLIDEALKKEALKLNKDKDNNDITIYNIYNRLTHKRSLFYSQVEKQAKKIFLDSINSTHDFEYSDFELHKVGIWNQHSGVITSLKQPEIVMLGEFKKELDNQLVKLITSVVEKETVKFLKLSEKIKDEIKKTDELITGPPRQNFNENGEN